MKDNILLQNSQTIEKSYGSVINSVLTAKYDPIIIKFLSQWQKGWYEMYFVDYFSTLEMYSAISLNLPV